MVGARVRHDEDLQQRVRAALAQLVGCAQRERQMHGLPVAVVAVAERRQVGVLVAGALGARAVARAALQAPVVASERIVGVLTRRAARLGDVALDERVEGERRLGRLDRGGQVAEVDLVAELACQATA